MRRLFFALEPDEPTRALALEVASSLRIALGAGVRVGWTAEGRLHVTLAFLGEVEETRVAGLRELVEAVAREHAAFAALAGGVGAFPAPDRARVLWLGFGRASEPLDALVADLALRLRSSGLALEERPFHGHITLARCRSPRGIDAREALRRTTDRIVEAPVASLALMESLRDEAGPRYAVLARAALGQPG